MAAWKARDRVKRQGADTMANDWSGSNVRLELDARFQPVLPVGQKVHGYIDTTPYDDASRGGPADMNIRTGGNVDVPRPGWGNMFEMRLPGDKDGD